MMLQFLQIHYGVELLCVGAVKKKQKKHLKWKAGVKLLICHKLLFSHRNNDDAPAELYKHNGQWYFWSCWCDKKYCLCVKNSIGG